MIRFKKLITGMTCAAFILSGTSLAAVIPSDAANTNYEEAAELLGALNIMVGDAESGNFRPADNIRRSEFAKIAVATIGLGDVANSANHQTIFPDVVENHWANGYINTAVAHGLIVGDENGNFRPDDNVSFAEAVTVLVRMVGHEPSAENKGTWPTGHIVVANSIGITKNIPSQVNNSPVIRGIVANLTFNALTVDIMEQTGFGSDIKYEVVDKTILEDTLGITKENGQITANEYTKLDSENGLAEGRVLMGETIYRVGKTNAKNLLGHQAILYSKEIDAAEPELIVARADKTKNNILSLSSKNISSVTQPSSSSKTTVKYWENKNVSKNTKNAYISAGAKLIYNGKSTEYSTSLLKPAFGTVHLLDTNKDSEADIVFVDEYTNYVVEHTSEASHTISDKYGNASLVLDPDNSNIKFTIEDKNGQPVEFSSIKEWNILSVTHSKSKDLIRVVVSTDSITGKVTEIGEDTVKIGDNHYEVASNYPNTIKINDEGIFYLDMDGKIAAVDSESARSGNYAYLITAAKSENISNTVEFKLFTKEGETLILNGNDKIRFNGTSSQSADKVLSLLSTGGSVNKQLITYEVNSENKISTINIAADKTLSVEFNKSFTKNFEGDDIVYKSVSSKLGRFNITDDTLVFDIPNGETNSDNYAVRGKDMFVNENKYNVSVYDMNEDFSANVVIVTNSSGKTSAESPIAVVEKITSVQNDRGENVEKITVTHKGESVSFLGSRAGIFVTEGGSKLAVGDIIQFKTNIRGEIDTVSVLLDASDSTEFKTESEDGLVTIHGKVMKKFTNSVNVSVNGGEVDNYTLNNVTIYKYDSEKKNSKVSVASAADITKYDEADGQTLFIRIYKDEVKEMVIIK